ncbi:hypothetical protein GINT2_000472 [Glugoides intestinalis]
MQYLEKDRHILSNIFSKYIFHSYVNRAIIFPVIFIMVIAKYTEVICARKIEAVSKMIKLGETNLSILLSYSVVIITSIILVEIQSFAVCKVGRIGYRLASRDTLGYFLELAPEKFGSFGLGEIQNIVGRRSQAVQDLIDVFVLNFLPSFLTMIFVSYEVLKGMGLIVVLIINFSVFFYAIVTINITKWRNKMRKRLNIAQNKSSNIIFDSLSNFDTVFTYKSSDYEMEKYSASLRNVEKHSTEIARSLYLLNLAQKGIWSCMSITIIFLSCYSTSPKITIEKFTFLTYITGLIMKTFDNFGFMYGKYKEAMTNAKISEILQDNPKDSGYRTAFRLNHKIMASGITIKKEEHEIIDDANFKIDKGDKIAIIGKNGAGKSTLLKSLIKLNKYSGEISIDNIKYTDLTDASIKNIITFIPQTAVLFEDTVMANIKYGNHKIFDEEVYRASKELGIHDSIMKLQNGYATYVGEQGKLLSGGERQKVLLLRAILRQTSVLLMDESTASLDKPSELKIIDTIVKNTNLTVLAIIHNLSLLKFFNKVFLVKDGKVIEIEDFNGLKINCELKEEQLVN